MANGIIVQRKSCSKYQGIEGDNWYLYSDKDFETYLDENIRLSWYRDDFVDVCNDLEFVNKYIKKSKELGIEYRVLLCSTEKSEPQFNIDLFKNKEFLGYDYAYLGGSYYSAVNSDVGRIAEFEECELNKFGLFDTLDEVLEFVDKREKLKYNYPVNHFEGGEFAVYKLHILELV